MEDRFSEYKVISIHEGGCGTVLLGSAGIPIRKMETVLNQEASEGWQVVFQLIERKRMMLFWTRESVIVTLAR